jgi:hypothetical protein
VRRRQRGNHGGESADRREREDYRDHQNGHKDEAPSHPKARLTKGLLFDTRVLINTCGMSGTDSRVVIKRCRIRESRGLPRGKKESAACFQTALSGLGWESF